MVKHGQLIPVRIGDTEVDVEVVIQAGTQPTAGRLSKVAGGVTDAFDRAQKTIVEVARSTAKLIDGIGEETRPDRVGVEFGLKFSVAGGVIMAGVAAEATLKVTLSYDVPVGSGNPRHGASDDDESAGNDPLGDAESVSVTSGE